MHNITQLNEMNVIQSILHLRFAISVLYIMVYCAFSIEFTVTANLNLKFNSVNLPVTYICNYMNSIATHLTLINHP